MSKELHDRALRQGREEAIALLTPEFANVGRKLMEGKPAITKELMGEIMIRAGALLYLEDEPLQGFAMRMLDIAIDIEKKMKAQNAG